MNTDDVTWRETKKELVIEVGPKPADPRFKHAHMKFLAMLSRFNKEDVAVLDTQSETRRYREGKSDIFVVFARLSSSQKRSARKIYEKYL